MATHKILGICASFRKNGNSSIILNEMLRPSREKGYDVEAIGLGEYKILPCTGCFSCNNSGFKCVLKDDLEPLKQKLDAADAIAIASPSYFLSAPSSIKAILDRTAVWGLDHIIRNDKKKLGIAASVAGGTPEWFSLQRVYLSSFLGLYNCDIVGQLTIGDTAFKGEILLTPSKLKMAGGLGEHLALSLERGKCIKYEDGENKNKHYCKNCYSDVFQTYDDDSIVCAVCNMGQKRSGDPFDPQYYPAGISRFTPEGAIRHIDHIGHKLESGLEIGEEIDTRLQEYMRTGMVRADDFIAPKGGEGPVRGIEWDGQALETLKSTVPGHFQGFVKKAVEKRASQKGLSNITKEAFLAIKRESGK